MLLRLLCPPLRSEATATACLMALSALQGPAAAELATLPAAAASLQALQAWGNPQQRQLAGALLVSLHAAAPHRLATSSCLYQSSASVLSPRQSGEQQGRAGTQPSGSCNGGSESRRAASPHPAARELQQGELTAQQRWGQQPPLGAAAPFAPQGLVAGRDALVCSSAGSGSAQHSRLVGSSSTCAHHLAALHSGSESSAAAGGSLDHSLLLRREDISICQVASAGAGARGHLAVQLAQGGARGGAVRCRPACPSAAPFFHSLQDEHGQDWRLGEGGFGVVFKASTCAPPCPAGPCMV